MTPYFQNAHGELYHGDCLEVMEWLPTRYVPFDMVMTDPPYGTTACKWDAVIPFEPMWRGVDCAAKVNAAKVLTASQPFTSALTLSRACFFRYGFVWDKCLPTGFQMAKTRPLKQHEDVLVFYSKQPVYNPQRELRAKPRSYNRGAAVVGGETLNTVEHDGKTRTLTHFEPRSIIKFSNANNAGKAHPTQKPVALFSYLIKTYTNPGETVLDFCAGSGTTAVAAQETGRRWVMIEKEEKYCEIIAKRLEDLCEPQTGGTCTDAGRGWPGNSVTTHAESAR